VAPGFLPASRAKILQSITFMTSQVIVIEMVRGVDDDQGFGVVALWETALHITLLGAFVSCWFLATDIHSA
jgi:hypothetical protein